MPVITSPKARQTLRQEHSYCPSPAYSVHTHSMPIPVIAPRAAERSFEVAFHSWAGPSRSSDLQETSVLCS